ncbi:hypothetical protein, partial [Salmonella enterica]|uniref:hypothetical protein n=1 Tax=Salmonella enterica TaxID=28901 RepID=UPI003CFA0ED8
RSSIRCWTKGCSVPASSSSLGGMSDMVRNRGGPQGHPRTWGEKQKARRIGQDSAMAGARVAEAGLVASWP